MTEVHGVEGEDEVCEVDTAKLPSVPDCKGMVAAARDKAAGRCPKRQAMHPSQAANLKLSCEHTSRKQTGDKPFDK